MRLTIVNLFYIVFQYEDFWIITLKNLYFVEVETPYGHGRGESHINKKCNPHILIFSSPLNEFQILSFSQKIPPLSQRMPARFAQRI